MFYVKTEFSYLSKQLYAKQIYQNSLIHVNVYSLGPTALSPTGDFYCNITSIEKNLYVAFIHAMILHKKGCRIQYELQTPDSNV